MTEYVDKKHLDRKFQIDMMCLRGGTILDTQKIIDSLPPADVVERSEYEALLKENHKLAIKYDNAMNRVADDIEEISRLHSKIDKSIEEITNLRQQYPNEDYYDCKWEILQILKKNIGD